MTKKQKIISCIEKVNLQSCAKMCNASVGYVSYIWSQQNYYWGKKKQLKLI